MKKEKNPNIANGVLKLKAGKYNAEWSLTNKKTKETMPLSPADIVYFLRVWTGAVQKGFVFAVPKLYFRNGEKNAIVFGRNQISSIICKNIPETEFKIVDKTLYLLSDNTATSLSYQLTENISKNFKDGKLTAIKSVPYITRLHDDKGTSYEESFKSTVKVKLIPQSDKRVEVFISFKAFKDGWFISMKFTMNLKGRDYKEKNSYYSILKRIESKDYKIASIGLSVKPKVNSNNIKQKQKAGLALLISYKFEKEEIRTRDNIMGITIGQRHIAAYSIIDPFNGKRVASGCINPPFDWKGYLVKLKKQKSELQSLYHNARNGGDELSARKARFELNRLRNREKNFMLTIYRPASIIKIAKENNVSLIRMEDLDISQNDVNKLKIKKYNYRTAQEYVEQLAVKDRKNAIKVEYVDAAGSVMRCSECGCVGITKRTNRPKPDLFKCVSCGFKEEPDINQSHNIALNAAEEIRKSILSELKDKFGYDSIADDVKTEELIGMRASFYEKDLIAV